MLGSKSKPNYDKHTTLIGSDTILEGGTLKATGTVRIDGKYIGEVYVDGDVFIGDKGTIEGNMKAHHILVAGKVEGNIECVEQVHLSSTAIINGDIICSTIVVDEGAIFRGNCQMNPASNGKKTPSSVKKESPKNNANASA